MFCVIYLVTVDCGDQDDLGTSLPKDWDGIVPFKDCNKYDTAGDERRHADTEGR